MHALDIPEEQIGSSDQLRGVAWRVFFTHERDGARAPLPTVTNSRIVAHASIANPSQALFVQSPAGSVYSL
jgi:hypothetical protein